MSDAGQAPPGREQGAARVEALGYTQAAEELDRIIAELDRGVVDVDVLEERLCRAVEIVEELDRRIRGARERVDAILPRLERVASEGDRANDCAAPPHTPFGCGIPVAFLHMADRIERVGVVGAGLMGSGIAEVCARAGLDVRIVEADSAAAQKGRGRVERSLATAVKRGKVSEGDAEGALQRISYETDLKALADRELLVEAITEDESAKVAVFRSLDDIVTSEHALFASNTSSIPIMKLASVTDRPEQVLGLHFFNPVPVLRLVELVTSLLTSSDTVERATEFATETLGKRVIRSQDRAGFVVNALLIPYMLSAIRMLESGFATRDDIDAGMVEGCAHPMGPLALSDLVGLDTMKAVAESLYEEFKEPLYAPPPMLLRMVEAGLLGRKSGRGFYDYGERRAA
jgi:3-hydroxybutyryl-CoA dehydrogenase